MSIVGETCGRYGRLHVPGGRIRHRLPPSVCGVKGRSCDFVKLFFNVAILAFLFVFALDKLLFFFRP